MSATRVLSGIQPTSASFHIGNYIGAVRQWVALQEEHEVFYFLADLHSMIKSQDAGALGRSTREIAATWLALGLDPERVVFYRQSECPILKFVKQYGLVFRHASFRKYADAQSLIQPFLRTLKNLKAAFGTFAVYQYTGAFVKEAKDGNLYQNL